MHLIALHDSAGSGNPLGVSGNYDRLPFAPYFIFKDLITIFLFIVVLSVFVFFMPNLLGDSENYVMANPMQTPPAIVPEWYLLPFYAILRSIPNKLLGVIAMFSAILILLVMPFTDLGRSRGLQFRPLSKLAFYIFIANFLILMQLGAKHVESPFIEFGQVSTVWYFSHFLIIVPLVSLLENSLVELHTNKKKSVTRYPWLSYQFYLDLLQGLLNRAYTSLEWSLNSPPKPHAFPSLPLQSGRSFKAFITVFLVAALVYISVKLPFLVMFKHLDLFWLYTLILGTSAALSSMIIQGLDKSKSIDLKKVLITFSTGVLLGVIICILNFYFKETYLEWLDEKIGVIATSFLGLWFIIHFFFELYFTGCNHIYLGDGSILRGLTSSTRNVSPERTVVYLSEASRGTGRGLTSSTRDVNTERTGVNLSEASSSTGRGLTSSTGDVIPESVVPITSYNNHFNWFVNTTLNNLHGFNERMDEYITLFNNLPYDRRDPRFNENIRRAKVNQDMMQSIINYLEQNFAQRAVEIREVNGRFHTNISTRFALDQSQRNILHKARYHINMHYREEHYN